MANAKNGGVVAASKENRNVVENKKATMQGLILSMEKEIKKALPSVITPERFTRMALTALSTTPALMDCTPKSFLGAIMQAAQLGVEPNTPLGQAYLIPYKNKGVLECQFQLGYKGLIDLAYRSEEVSIVDAHEVYENDTFEYELGLNPVLRHVPARRDRGNVIYYYAIFRTVKGGYGFKVMSVDDVKSFAAKKSKSYSSSFSPWTTDFDEMAKKTVLKKALKYAPLKTDFVRAIAADETVKTEIGANMLEVKDETSYIDVETTESTPVKQSEKLADGRTVDTGTGEISSGEGFTEEELKAAQSESEGK